MICKKKPLVLALAQAIGVGSLIATSQAVLAQPAPETLEVQKLDRITVTGSSIRRTVTEGALPVLTLDRAFIEQSGATSATELIQSLPQVQNFVANSASVNGGGGGTATASLHALPSKYTLVLIDGVRMPATALSNSFGGGFGANINSVPLDAVDHVEILLDGATAVYGSDAIAGVVNFILKKNTTAGNAYGNVIWPQHPGGGGWQAGISKGWGDLDKDGFNVQGTFGFQHQDKLEATQRDFSAQGAYFPFSHNGVNYIYNGRTSNTEPANITFNAKPAGGGATQAYTINPYYSKNGNCGTPFAAPITDPATLGAVGVSCRFNYAATVQNIPEYDQANFVGKGYWKINADTTAWASIGLSSFDTKSQYAPPAQPLGLNNTTRLPSLYAAYVQPYLTANNLVNASSSNSATIGYRAVGQGGRTDDYKTVWQQYSLGIDGRAWGWDYNARLTTGISVLTDTAAGGYTDYNLFAATVGAGLYDPVMSTGGATIKPFILGEQFSRSKSTLNNAHFGVQHDFFELQGGPTIVALGADYYYQKYSIDYSSLILSQSGFSTQPDSANYPIGGNYGQVPFGANRSNWAVYGEWFVPILKSLEATASVRYDYYDKVHSNYVFSSAVNPDTGLQDQIANADLGNSFNKTTGKISVRWLPIESLLLRGSYGTGFRAPAIGDIAGALTFAGSTQNSYACPFPGSPGCLPGSAQYDLVAGPNGLGGTAGLKAETSDQYTLGARWEPIKGLSFGADYWNVKLKNQVISQGIAEQVGFANPQQYVGLFINPYQDPAGFTTIAFSQLPFNGGQANFSGVDYDLSWRTPTPWGMFFAGLTGTYMIQAQYNDGPGQPYNTDLGVYGPDQQVVFRNTMQLILSLQTGAWYNSLIAHYKTGYQDASYSAGVNIFLAKPDGSQGATTAFCCLSVPAYYTFDWQTAYNLTKDVRITFGITNLFDKDPPLTLQSGGGGNQIGYDGRYADPIGRAFYLRAGIKF
jgi:iron complex outermembrane receptor protein